MDAPTVRLTRAQVREVDRRAIEQYHIPGIVLMENAARGATEVIWDELANTHDRKVLILCGGGNNGGDGLAVARHLHNRGATVSIGFTSDPAKLKGDALINWQVVQAMGLPHFEGTPEAVRGAEADIVVDAVFGTGLDREPRPPFAEIVAAVGEKTAPVLAIDLPSGLDCDRGEPLGACIRATKTVTFVAEKAGFENPASKKYTGQVTVADIGSPPEIVSAILAGR